MASVQEIKDKFKSVTEERDRNNVRKIELETQIKVSREDLQKKMKQLKSDFGLDSIDAAEKELAKLEGDINTELSECEEFLSKYEV